MGEDMVVLCGYEVEPSVIAGVPDDKIAGVIMGQGSTTCHAVIIAKSRAIPTVVGIEHQTDEIPEGAKVVLDGHKGLIIIDPDPATLLEYMEKLGFTVRDGRVYYLPKDLFQFKPNARWYEAYRYLYELLYDATP